MENSIIDTPIPRGEVLASIGYSQGITETPSIVTESLGFKQALRDLGLTEELITSSLVQDIKAKPEKRIQELKLGAEILGMVKREDEQVKTASNTYNFLFSPEVQANIKAIDNQIKEQLVNHESNQKN